MHIIGERLKKERLRLKISQENLGKIGGVSKRSQINYEQGISLPDASYLALVSEVGVDILFVVTGASKIPDRKTLETAIFAVESGLDSIEKTMPPDKKADLILAACDLIVDDSDSTKIVRLISSVA